VSKKIQARVFVLPGGKLQIFIDSGTDEQAIEATQTILAKLKASGMEFDSVGDIEFHRDGRSDHIHVVQQNQQELRHEH
jgi:hypothetical protein